MLRRESNMKLKFNSLVLATQEKVMGNIPTQNQSSPIFLSDLSVVRIPRYFVLTKQLLALEMLRLTLKISFISQVVILLFPLPTTKISVVLELHHWDTCAVAEVWMVNL